MTLLEFLLWVLICEALAQGWMGLVFIHLTAEVTAEWTGVWT